jgi:hypothetical protein
LEWFFQISVSFEVWPEFWSCIIKPDYMMCLTANNTSKIEKLQGKLNPSIVKCGLYFVSANHSTKHCSIARGNWTNTSSLFNVYFVSLNHSTKHYSIVHMKKTIYY